MIKTVLLDEMITLSTYKEHQFKLIQYGTTDLRVELTRLAEKHFRTSCVLSEIPDNQGFYEIHLKHAPKAPNPSFLGFISVEDLKYDQ